MRKYETTYILDATLSDEDQTTQIERFQRVVGEQGGTVESVDKWERRRLAYEVKGKREGIYIVMNFTAPPAAEAELQRLMRITDSVLRHIVVKIEEKKPKRYPIRRVETAEPVEVAS